MTSLRFAALACALAPFLTADLAAQPALPRDRAPQVGGSIREFVDRLYSADPRERAEAACQIGRRHADAAAAIPILLSMLSDDVAVSAIDCEMSPWLRRSRPLDAEARKWMETSPAKEAAEALGDIGNEAVPGLLQSLEHGDRKTRGFAALGLGEVDRIIELEKVIDGLAHRLTDVHPDVRDRSAWALGEIEHASAVDGLTGALKDDDWRVRKTAVWALGEIEDPVAIDALRAAASDPNGEVRRAVAHAIRELRDRDDK